MLFSIKLSTIENPNTFYTQKLSLDSNPKKVYLSYLANFTNIATIQLLDPMGQVISQSNLPPSEYNLRQYD